MVNKPSEDWALSLAFAVVLIVIFYFVYSLFEGLI